MEVTHKIVWITGASSGIGAAVAELLAKEKARLILTARREDRLQALNEALSIYTEVALLPADLYAGNTLEALTHTAIAQYGHIDLVIHAAGVGQRSFATETSMQVYRQLMEINFFAPVAITRALLPHFQERGGGHIAVIGSMAGLMGFPGRTGYAAAKHAVKGFFETLQVEPVAASVNVTIISPGRIQTDLSLSAITGTGTPHGKMDAGQINGIPVHECARQIVHAIRKNKRHVMIARKEKWLYRIRLLFAPLYYRIASTQQNP